MLNPWQPLTTDGLIRGFEAHIQNTHFFFGTRYTSKEDLQKLFPHYQFCFLKQVHGDKVVMANARETLEADAHYTVQSHMALVIQTADCLPILFTTGRQVFAVHAGWRGIAQNIIGACKPFVLSAIQTAAVGPHIQKSSFEVGVDVSEQLERLGPTCRPFVFPHQNPEKRLVDLNVLAEKQLFLLNVSPPPVYFLEQDTVTDPLFHSFRRGKQTPDRQYSFVVITDHST